MPNRDVDALARALITAINQARVINSLLYGARVRLESLPRDPDAALDAVRSFRADLDAVVAPIEDLTDRLVEALQKTADPRRNAR
jgi:hypothetical protein